MVIIIVIITISIHHATFPQPNALGNRPESATLPPGNQMNPDSRNSIAIRTAMWILLAFAVAGSVAARLRLIDLPLERDEGEYAYTGQLMLQGIVPYELAYRMKFPGTA